MKKSYNLLILTLLLLNWQLLDAQCITTITSSNVSCFNAEDGTATATITGTGLFYSWSNGENTQTISGLTPGVYIVTATDASGCTDAATVVISQPSAINVTIGMVMNAECAGSNNGSATASASGGVTGVPYDYLWSNGQTTPTATALTAGMYTVTVSDANNCTGTQTVTILEPPAITISMNAVQNVACFGGSTGTVTAVPTGGVPGYQYQWSNTQTVPKATNLSANTYTVTVTDTRGCTQTQTASITQPALLSVTTGSIVNVSCFGTSTGSVTATPAGGTSPFFYAWNNGQTTPKAMNLAAGNYTVSITDANGCTATRSAIITQPSAALSASASATAETTAGAHNGTASVNVSGGTPNYTYAWSGGGSSAAISGLAPGTYTVTVTDALGCNTTTSATVTAGPPPGGPCTTLPVYALLGPTEVCGNTPFELLADDLHEGSAIQYIWVLPNGDSITTSDPALTLSANSTAYSGEYFVIRDSAGCRSIAVGGAIVNVITLDNVSAGNDEVLCSASQVQLIAASNSSGTGSWVSLGAATIDSPTQNQTLARNLQPGANVFVWQVALGNCPQAGTDTVTYFLENKPLVKDDHYKLERAFDVIVMEVLLNDALGGLSDTLLQQLTTPSTGQLEMLAGRRFRYTVEEDFRGVVTFQYVVCSGASVCNLPCDTATVSIDVQNLPTVPTGLVVGDEGLNGAMGIRGIKGFERVEITITDRWGDLVFQENDYDNMNPWAGTFKRTGQYLPGGAYYYFLKAFDRQGQVGDTITGVIHLFSK